MAGSHDDGLEVDEYRGHWVNLEQRVVHTLSPNWQLTVGAEGAYHFDVQQTARDAGGYFLDQRGAQQQRYGALAGYGIVDVTLSARWRMSLGGRVDHYTTFGTRVEHTHRITQWVALIRQ
jgi:outer membrane receptor protein involved in Fe transport